MKRFAIAAALAVALGVGLAGTANAQYVQRYTTITPNGGVASGGYLYTPGAVQSYNSFLSPFGTVTQRSSYGDVFGNNYGTVNRYNVFNGYGYNSSYYLPSPYVYPTPISTARGFTTYVPPYRRW